MGFLSFLGLADVRPSPLATSENLGVVSPYAAPSHLAQFAVGEVYGSEVAALLPMGRADALAIPAVAKARNLLVSTIAQYPLEAIDSSGQLLTNQPLWLTRTDGPVSPYHRAAATVDDLIFYGHSLWMLQRGAKQEGSRFGPIIDAAWVPQAEWKIENGSVVVHDIALDDGDYILFEVPLFPGLLSLGARTLRGARDTELAWTSRMESPAYLVELRMTSDTEMTSEEAEEWVDEWVTKHRSGKPSVGLNPLGLEMHTHAGSLGEADLFIQSRDAIRTDVGSFLNVRAAMLDGTTGVDSLTYSTTEGERNAFFEIDLPMWTRPIEEAITQALPRTQRARFNFTETHGATSGASAPAEPTPAAPTEPQEAAA
ncbi:hypothetical protein [Marisediminicola sp. LYQ85]|uniref:hypothetical protein n=1 Tax=Marisediminicola sp. LYQ85 TaxID=3391062 RepID=UPI0039830BE6